jgi:uncharacterized protein involved in exopolysaccharide biosynthesis
MTAAPFLLCVDRLDRADGRVWAVVWRGRWRVATAVHVTVPVATVFKGAQALQPKAYLTGVGVVRRKQGALWITRG